MMPTREIHRIRTPFTWLAKSLLAAGILGSLLFAHGCHGNEDNELFTAVVEWVSVK